MIARAASIALAVATVVGLTGCVTPREPPRGPSEADRAEIVERRIDQAWMRTGLTGTVDRPVVEVSDDVSFAALAACIDSYGITGWNLYDSPDGMGFNLDSGVNTAAVQLAMFTCFAQHPVDPVPDRPLLSRAQLDYLYDYYGSWVIPCLALESITVQRIPTRDQFMLPAWRGWTPYNSSSSITTEQAHADAVDKCGDPYADLDVTLPDSVFSSALR